MNIALSQGDSVQTAVEIMGRRNVGAVLVVEQGSLVGIFSERDVMTRVLSRGMDPHRIPLAEVMTRNVVVASKDETAESCLQKMESLACRHLPVMDGDTPIAMLSVRDLMRAVLRNKEGHLRMLEEYVKSY